MKHGTVIVGTDGSAPSRSAVHWAAAEATRRGTGLRVLHAYRAHWPDSVYLPEQAEEAARGTAHEVLEAALADAREHAPGIHVSGGYALGGPAQVLLDDAGANDLIVVGSRGHSGFAAALLGSTSQQVATHAPGQVAVVRGRSDTAAGPVVVGFDGSPSAEHALDAAFEEAAGRGCGLTVVRAYRPTSPAWPINMPPPPIYNPETVKAALLDELAQIVRPWVDKYPDVPVERAVTAGDAADVLVDASRGAQLVVLGSRGHGGFAGLLLGSVGLHLLHHADCPVLIVRH